MTRLDWSRRPTYDTRPSDLPKATPIPRSQRRALAQKRAELRRQHRIANQPPEQKHAQHPAVVTVIQGQPQVWCQRCQCQIQTLTAEQYSIWREINPPQIKRVKKT